MALTLCSGCRKAGWLTIYKNQYFIARNFTSETHLLGDSIIKGLIRYKRTWFKYFPNSLNSAAAEIALKMFFGEL